MGDLSEELLKAGLISQKKFKQTQHTERVKHTAVGAKGLEAEEQTRRAAQDRQRDSQRAQDRQRVREQHHVVEEQATRARLKDIVRGGAVKAAAAGNRKYYFETTSGKLPYVEVNDEAARALQHGELAIVQIPDVKLERFVILPARIAVQVKQLEPDLLRVFRD